MGIDMAKEAQAEAEEFFHKLDVFWASKPELEKGERELLFEMQKLRKKWRSESFGAEAQAESEGLADKVIKALNLDTPSSNPFIIEVNIIVDQIKNMLIEKNKAYGDSALNPIRCFSKAPAEAGIDIRLDDKLSRIKRGDENAFGEDVIDDLIGYLILKKIARKNAISRSKEVFEECQKLNRRNT